MASWDKTGSIMGRDKGISGVYHGRCHGISWEGTRGSLGISWEGTRGSLGISWEMSWTIMGISWEMSWTIMGRDKGNLRGYPGKGQGTHGSVMGNIHQTRPTRKRRSCLVGYCFKGISGASWIAYRAQWCHGKGQGDLMGLSWKGTRGSLGCSWGSLVKIGYHVSWTSGISGIGIDMDKSWLL